MIANAERDIGAIFVYMSVCLSVCPSHSGIVSKRTHISSKDFHPEVFELYRRYKIRREGNPLGVKYAQT